MRPINIVDFENRILANAVRLRLDPLLARWICPEQRGFLPGRSLLSNVLDVEEAMIHTAAGQPNGAALFMDFKAAFASISHCYLMAVAATLGLPRQVLRFRDVLYSQVRCELVVGTKRRHGVEFTTGIRQGCPLSLCWSSRL